jgi:hypothetical protein
VTPRETAFIEEDSVIADALDRKEIQSDDMYSIVPKLKCLAPGTVIPKPEAKDDFTLKGWGKRNGESALIYLIPNHSDPQRPYQKGVTEGEWEQAHQRLLTSGEFTRKWFNAQMPRCSREGTCNFTAIGGIFAQLGLAAYDGRGVYCAVSLELSADRLELRYCFVLSAEGRTRSTENSATTAEDRFLGLM